MPIPEGAVGLRWREIAKLCHAAGWRNQHLVEAVAVCLSESGGYPTAYHDNAGPPASRDVGLFQINIPESKVGTAYEHNLYDVTDNIYWARGMFLSRGWQPWYGYTNGFAMSTEWWRWSATRGAWFKTGRYLHRAIIGVTNFYVEKNGLRPLPYVDLPPYPPAPTHPPAAAGDLADPVDQRGLLNGEGWAYENAS